MKIQIERVFYILAFLASIVGFLDSYTILRILLFLLSMTYIVSGWYFLNPEPGKRFDPTYFIVGYAFSTFLMTMLFYTGDWPLLKEFQFVSIFFLLVSAILIITIKKIRGRGSIEILAKILLFLAIVVSSMLI